MPHGFSYVSFLNDPMKSFHLRFYRFYAMLGIYTKHALKEGICRGDYRSKPRREAAYSQRLRPPVSGKWLHTQPLPKF